MILFNEVDNIFDNAFQRILLIIFFVLVITLGSINTEFTKTVVANGYPKRSVIIPLVFVINSVLNVLRSPSYVSFFELNT